MKMVKVLALLLALFVLAAPVLAQDVAEDNPVDVPVDAVVDEPADPTPVDWFDLGYVVTLIIGTVSTIVLGAFGGAPITTFLVSLVKRLPFLEGVSAPTLTFLVAGVLWVLTVIFGVVGFGAQWQNFLDVIAETSPVILGFITTLIGAPILHEAAAKRNVAVLGYKRTESPNRSPSTRW